MGTVGLSFGSPTSGTGFDVSSTVSSIVANLQNVETPWKTQLTSLESQDTVISSLGTLLSNVSNDLSSLTDFSGIMAEKTGSSSDENVLELTSATSSAVAGTHTVEVNSLAQTSSGYLAEVSSASDTVSGSITLATGSGTAQTITLDSSDNTLTGLAATINATGGCDGIAAEPGIEHFGREWKYRHQREFAGSGFAEHAGVHRHGGQQHGDFEWDTGSGGERERQSVGIDVDRGGQRGGGIGDNERGEHGGGRDDACGCGELHQCELVDAGGGSIDCD
jgi:hypothetical protein